MTLEQYVVRCFTGPMGWDQSRPVPWDRLIRDWLLYAAIMTAVFLVFFRSNNPIGAIAGVLISGPLYLAVGAVMAKFGYTRKRFKELREEGREQAASRSAAKREASASTEADTTRRKPAPTSRTAGSQRPASTKKRKR